MLADLTTLRATVDEEKCLHELSLNRAGVWAAKAVLATARADHYEEALRKIREGASPHPGMGGYYLGKLAADALTTAPERVNSL